MHVLVTCKCKKDRIIKKQPKKDGDIIFKIFKLERTFMPILVTSNFDDDLIKNERASMETALSNYKSMGNFLDIQGQLTP